MEEADDATEARLESVMDDAKAVGGACSGLHVRVDKLRDELVGLVDGEAALREDTQAVLRSALEAGLSAERSTAAEARATLRADVEAELVRAQQAAEVARVEAEAAAAAEREAAAAAAGELRGVVEAQRDEAAAAVAALREQVDGELEGVRGAAAATRQEVDAAIAAERETAAAAAEELRERVAAELRGALEAVEKVQEEVTCAMKEEREVAEAAREELRMGIVEVQEAAATGADGCKAGAAGAEYLTGGGVHAGCRVIFGPSCYSDLREACGCLLKAGRRAESKVVASLCSAGLEGLLQACHETGVGSGRCVQSAVSAAACVIQALGFLDGSQVESGSELRVPRQGDGLSPPYNKRCRVC